MSVVITSTTDSAEAITAALGDLAPKNSGEDKKSASTPEKETDETADESDTSDETETEQDLEAKADDDDSESKDDDQKPKKKNGFKKRIDKLTSKLSAKEQEAEYWKAEALKQKPTEKSAEKSPPKESVQTKEADASKPNPDDFDSHSDYVEALTDWKVDQKEKQKETKAKEEKLKADFQSKLTSHFDRVKSFTKAHDDFEDVMEEVDDIPMPFVVQDIFVNSEIGPELMYELAKNKKEFERICKLPDVAAARELGKLEARLAKNSEPEKETKQLKTTKVPPPVKPVGSKSSTGSSKSPDEMSFQEYKQWRLANPNI